MLPWLTRLEVCFSTVLLLVPEKTRGYRADFGGTMP
ncbi:hypothetical protein SAMN05192562_103273 [Kosakonia arachidis]|uniref:Uncharacterized protein n=1 Tax=Kosakonia arachidis TaxID=551989 RepID=A0A1I7C652_9ENTR|nr:phage portal protein [Kosakonia arachidis]SFT94906.1 hypothetical protein SAMN05192562_103273 [Kosakonia arachidis]